MRLAFAAHQPRYGRITVHPTPLAGTGAYLAHDLIRALGKHLPVPDDNHDLPTWAGNSDRSWRITAAWILTLGITHLTICRAHRISAGQWEQLLALSTRTGLRLTLLCNGPSRSRPSACWTPSSTASSTTDAPQPPTGALQPTSENPRATRGGGMVHPSRRATTNCSSACRPSL